MPGGAGLRTPGEQSCILSEDASLAEESVWNKSPRAVTSSPAARVVSSDPAAAPGVVSGTLLTPSKPERYTVVAYSSSHVPRL